MHELHQDRTIWLGHAFGTGKTFGELLWTGAVQGGRKANVLKRWNGSLVERRYYIS